MISKWYGLATLAVLTIAAPPGLRSQAGDLEAGFRHVPMAERPWVYWWWLNGNVTKQSVTSDLEAMKKSGIGGLLMFDSRGYHDERPPFPPPVRLEFMSPEWRQMLKYSITEANRLGLEVSVNLSISAGALKGPWLVGDDSPKKLIWSASEVRGGQRLNRDLKRPEGKRFWDVALMAVRHDGAAATLPEGWQDAAPKTAAQPAVTEVLNLADKMDAQGRLAWDVPAGQWTLLHFGCVTMDGHEYDVDILDPKAVEGHFNRMGKVILQDVGPLAGRTLTHFYSVSWEGAAPTWTLALEQEFDKYRRYAVRPWLPVLAGFTVQSREASDRFLRDYYKTLADCFMNNFYGTLHELCGRAGLKWHSESGGPWNRKLEAFEQADQLAFLARNDMPQGEFWWPRRSMNRPAAMTAHVYGKRLAATEAFTHMQRHWTPYPATLKPQADAAFIDGINHFVWHTFTASPPALGKPGSEYFAGTHINPNVTWFPQAGPFINYLGRNQFMLRQGKFVADVCTYVGDRPYLHWDQGTNWSTRATLKLDPGYSYDLITTEVLLERLKVQDGDLVLPDGMRYRVLVVDLEEDIVPPPALRKLVELKQAGATIVFGERPPQRAPGLTDFPACDDEVRKLATELWGKGGRRLDEALKARRILPDFEGPWNFTHRRDGETDIYFVAGSGTADCTFRVSGQQPELWDPMTGHIENARNWRATDDGRTAVSISLPTNGATLVVFRKPAEPQRPGSVAAWQGGEMQLSGRWNVSFEPGRGAPKSAVFEELSAWNTHSEAGIKYFSGKATYRKTFELTKPQASQLVRLQLGEVKYIAQVRLNGKDLGVVWTDPWSVELTGMAKAGRNELEIDIVNTWANRLIGDAGLPEEKRITKSNVAFESEQRTLRVFQSFSATDTLMPSGLLGPVRLEFGKMEKP